MRSLTAGLPEKASDPMEKKTTLNNMKKQTYVKPSLETLQTGTASVIAASYIDGGVGYEWLRPTEGTFMQEGGNW